MNRAVSSKRFQVEPKCWFIRESSGVCRKAGLMFRSLGDGEKTHLRSKSVERQRGKGADVSTLI